MMVLLIFVVLSIGILIYTAIDGCRIELKYRNTLLENQNEILRDK